MPSYKPLAITYAESGLVKDRQAYITPNDAYVELLNAYVWRGITKRRLASEFLGRLRRVITSQAEANANGTGSYSIADVLTTFRANEPNASIECGSLVLRVDPGVGNETEFSDQGDGSLLRTSGTAYQITASSINYNTGAVSVTWDAGGTPIGGTSVETDYAYFPCLPAMGIHERELSATNVEDYVFFDTIYAYHISGGVFIELPSTTATTWSGSDSDFFWEANYWNDANGNRLFWITNGKFGGTVATSDPIRYYNGTTWNATAFLPSLKTTSTDALISAKLIIPYRNRLVVFNTLEASATAGGTATIQYQNRARWSINGDPTVIATAWQDNIQGAGGFVDAPTTEAIITAGFVRDTLIVYFERSTWKFRYTGNEILPFVWERINIELGAESKRSIVRFDQGLLTVGDKGITTCNGNNVSRMDEAIRDEVFKIHNGNNGVERVHGARNFFEQVVYWTIPASESNPVYPNRILLYNYDNNSWAFFDDHFTVLGPFQRITDIRWQDLTTVQWAQYRRSWASGRSQSGFPMIAGGNQQGYIHILNQKTVNEKSLHIFGITAGTPPTINVPSHNMLTGDFIEINGIVTSSAGAEALNGYRYMVEVVDADNFLIHEKPKFTITAITLGTTTQITAVGNNLSVGDRVEFQNVGGTVEINNRTSKVTVAGNTFTIDLDSSTYTAYTTGGTVQNLDGVFDDVVLAASNYIGCGEVTRVSGFLIRSKKFSMMPDGSRAQLGYIDFLVDRTDCGEVAVPIFADYNNTMPVNPRGQDPVFNSEISTADTGANTSNEDKVWHRLYCSMQAQFIQYLLAFDQAQRLSKQLQSQDFVLDSVVIWKEKGGRLVR